MANAWESDVLHSFVGREDFLQDLRHNWNTHRIFAVFGFKSVGKSRTVEEFLKRVISEYPNPDSISHGFIDLKSVKTSQSFVFQITTALGLIHEDPPDDVHLLAEEILSKLKTSKADGFILNFDNAEDVIESPFKDMFVALCERLIHKSQCLKIVLTSTVVVDFPEQKRCLCAVELPLLSHTDGVELLRLVTPNVKFTSTIDHQIVELCLGLPLAILMTGCELEMDNGYLSPEQMAVILTRNHHKVSGTPVPASHRLEALGRDCCYAKQEQIGHVYTSFIQRLTDVFRQRLTVLGYIPGSFTTAHAQQLLGDPSTQMTTSSTMCPLTERHMITYDSDRHRYNIHGIIRDCLQVYFTLDNQSEVRKRYCEIFCKVVQELSWMMSVSEFWDAVTDLAVEYPNVQKLLILVDESCQDTFHIYIQMVKSCAEIFEQYFGGESEKFYTQLLELCTRYGNPRSDAIVSRAYGRILTNVKGQFAEGERMYRRALGYFMRNPSSIDLAPFICQNLGWNLHLQGKLREALEYLQRARNYQITLGMKHTVTFATLTSIGIVHAAMGNFDEGEKYQMESIKRRIERHGEDHPHIGSMYDNLGVLYHEKGDHDKSSFYFRKGLEVKKANNGSSCAIILSLKSVASVEIDSGRFGHAKKLLDEAWALLQQSDMAYRVHETTTLETYGKLYLVQGDYTEAVRILETVTKLKEIVMGGSIGHVESILSLGRALQRGGNSAKALDVYREALTHKESVAREVPHNPVIWECLEETANILTEEWPLSKGDNCQDLMQVFSDGQKELLRIIGHFAEKGIIVQRDMYETKLRVWNGRREKWCKEGGV